MMLVLPDFSNPVWGVIGVLATVTFGLVTTIGIIIGFLQLVQNRKKISYEIQTITPILKIEEGLKERVEIRLDGKQVTEVYLIILRIFNSGRASIKSDDFERNLSITLKSGKIINVEIIDTIPSNLGNILKSFDSSEIVFEKALLNRKDEFTLNILVNDFSGDEEDISLDGRIDGVKEITQYRESQLLKVFLENDALTKGLILAAASLFPIVGSMAGAMIVSFLTNKALQKRSEKNK